MLPPSPSTLKDQCRTNRHQRPQGCRAGSSGREWPSVSCNTKRSPSPVTRDINLEITMEFVPITLKRMPRLSELGPLGMRAEHWYDFDTQAGDIDLFSRIIAHISTATLPDAVLQYLRAGQGTPLEKPTGRHRPLLMMSFFSETGAQSDHRGKKKNCRSWPQLACSNTAWTARMEPTR